MHITLLGGSSLPCAVPVCDRGPGVRAPRQREGERPEAGAAGPVPGGSRHNIHHTSGGESARVFASLFPNLFIFPGNSTHLGSDLWMTLAYVDEMQRWLLVLAVAAVAPVAWAQPLEFEPIDPPAVDKRTPARKQRSPQARGDAVQGQVYTYADGDRTVRVRLQSDLEVSGDSGVARSGGQHIVTKDSTRRSSGLPVFRSESSGTLMTLPGGVLLVLDGGVERGPDQCLFRPPPDQAEPGVGLRDRCQQFLCRDRAGLSVPGVGQHPGRPGGGAYLQPQLVARPHHQVSG